MTRPIMLLLALLRIMLGLCAAFLVLAALYVSLGRELLPLVGQYRIEVEDYASAALGVPVRIGELQGSWSGFTPRVVALDVRLGSEAHAPSIERLQVVPDLLASALARAPRLARIQIDGARLRVQQNESASWSVKGLALPERSTSGVDVSAALQQGQILSRLSVFDSQVVLQGYGQQPIALHSINLDLRNGFWTQRLDAQAALPDGQPLRLSVRGDLQPTTWQQANIELYLNAPQTDWSQWLAPLLNKRWQIDQVQASGELWLRTKGLTLEQAALKLQVAQLRVAVDQRPVQQVDNLSAELFVHNSQRGLEATLAGAVLEFAEQPLGPLNAVLREQPDKMGSRWALQLDQLDLAAWRPLVEALAPLPEPARQALQGLAPVGLLQRVNLLFDPYGEGAQRLSFASNLHNLGFAAYHGVPAAQQVSGSIMGDLGSGELRLDATDFSLHFPQLYPQPWQYQSARARLAWAVNPEQITLASPYMRLGGDEGQLTGDMLIRLYNDSERDDYMDLRVALTEGDARYTEKYLPTLSSGMSPALSQWLTTAIKAGEIEQGYFLYQGSLGKNAPPEAQVMNMFFRVANIELAYQPGWPVLRDASGDVMVEDSGVRVMLQQGKILNSTLHDVQAQVPLLKDGKAPRLDLSADLQSSVGDALSILQSAPIGTADVFTGWQGSGALAGHLQLDIPLSAGLRPIVVVDFSTHESRLQLPAPKLDISAIRGAFRFDSETGLSAPQVQARVFDQPISGSIQAQGRAGRSSSLLDIRGQVQVSALNQWLGGPAGLPVRGLLPYQLRLNLAGADSQLRVDSSLNGVAIDLPTPFGKAADETRAVQWRMTLQGAERRYWANYGDAVDLSFAAPLGALAKGRGELWFGAGAARLPSSAGLQVRGSLMALDVSQWQHMWGAQGAPVDAAQLSLLRDAQLRVGRLSGFGQQVDDVLLNLARYPQAWALRFESAQATGQVIVADAKATPIKIDLKHLLLAAPVASADELPADQPDALVQVDPALIPALDLTIAHLQRGDKHLGAWSLSARPVAQGVKFEQLNLNLQGLHINGELIWSGPAHARRTQYRGRLHGENLAEVLEAWSFAPSITSESFRLDVDGSWPGSPAWFALKRFDGRLDPALRNGQFVEVQGSAQALRVFGLLNFNSIGRRLRLDFSDLLDKGLSYDRIKGDLRAESGVLQTLEPLTLTGPSSNLELNGSLDLANDVIDATLLVALPVSNNLPIAALLVGAPAIGGALFLVDKLLGDKVAQFASVQYHVSGSLQHPELSFDKPF